MNRNAKILILVLFGTAALAGAVRSEDKQYLLDRVVAVVNNEVVTQSEFDAIFRPIYEQVKRAYQGSDLNRELQDIRMKLLNQLIEDKLVAQEAKKLGIEVGESEIREEMANFKKQFGDEAAFLRKMEEEHVRLGDIEARFRERIAIEKLHQYLIRGRIVISPNEVEDYYRSHGEEFNDKEKIQLWAITFPKSNEATEKGMMDERAKKQAEQVLAGLKKGADFATLAKKYSQDAHAQEGGLIGFVARGDLVPNIEEVIFSLPAGGISDVLETERAYHLFKVGEKTAAKSRAFDEVRDEIHNLLFRQRAHERFMGWMEELKKKSYISIR